MDSDSGGIVNIPADKILELADRIKGVEIDLRKLGLDGFLTQPNTRTPPRQKSSDLMAMQFDISGLGWQKKKSEGGGPAGQLDGWAWCFAYPDQDSPYPREECEMLVNALLQYGEIRVGKYIVKLAGRGNRLLNRRIAK